LGPNHQADRTGSAGRTVVHPFNSEKVVTRISDVLMEGVMVARVSVLGEAPKIEPDAEDRSAAQKLLPRAEDGSSLTLKLQDGSELLLPETLAKADRKSVV